MKTEWKSNVYLARSRIQVRSQVGKWVLKKSTYTPVYIYFIQILIILYVLCIFHMKFIFKN